MTPGIQEIRNLSVQLCDEFQNCANRKDFVSEKHAYRAECLALIFPGILVEISIKHPSIVDDLRKILERDIEGAKRQ